jgi:hypothetical protein
MTQTLAATPLVRSSAQNLLPAFELIDFSAPDPMDFQPLGKGTEAAVPEVCLTDVEGTSETIEWFRYLVAMAELSMEGTGLSVFAPT